MESNPDIIYDKFTQIKMLILFVMSRLPQPISIDVLTELTMCDDRISYFDVTECIGKLTGTKHLLLKDGKYTLTAKGIRNNDILNKNLPYSVKTSAEKAVEKIKNILALDALIKTDRTAGSQGGVTVGLALSDGISDILSMKIHTANEHQAEMLEKGFRKNASTIYHDILEVIIK